MALIKLCTPNGQEVGIDPAHVVLVLPSGTINNVQRWQVCHVGGGLVEVDFDGNLIDFINGLNAPAETELIEAKATKAKK